MQKKKKELQKENSLWYNFCMETIFANGYMEFFHLKSRSETQNPVFDLHSHNYYELYFFVSGKADWQVENRSYVVHSNTLCLFPPHCLHGIRLYPFVPYERFVVYLMPNPQLEPVLLRPFHHPRHLFCSGRTADISGFLRSLAECASFPDELRELATGARLRSLLCELSLLDFSAGPAAAETADERVRPIMDFINENLHRRLTLDELSHAFYMSRTHLQHLFERSVGISIHKYITTKRMSQAKQLIAEGNPPSKVFFRCGYEDYSSFFRAFQSYYGYPPKEANDHLF